MVNIVKFIGIITYTASVMLGFWACEEPKNLNSGLPVLTGTVSIDGYTQIGQMLTANTSGLGGDGTISYLWKRNGTDEIGSDNTYMVQTDDVGSTITVTVTCSGYSGSITSEPSDIITSYTPGLAFTPINNGTAFSVSKGTANASFVIIPAVFNELPVIEIADSGFSSYTNMTGIILPNGVTRIGNYAFFNCGNLESIVIPAGVTNIGNFAFQDCGSLDTIFYGGESSSNWASIAVGSSNTVLTGADRYYYSETNPDTIGFFWRFVNGVPVGLTHYSVTFNSNGGSAVTDQIIANGSKATRPGNPTRDGYIFDNWYSDSELTEVYNFSAIVTSSITLYAKWIDVYTVNFNSNGGSTVPAQDIVSGNTATRPLNPTRSGYVLDNWYSDSELTAVYNFSTPVTSGIMLYAKWLEACTVIFNSNGGSAVTDQIIGNGSTVTRPGNPTRNGYVLEGWYNDSGLTTVYNFSTSVTFNITLYAKWKVWNVNTDGIEMVQIPAGTLTWPDAKITLSTFKMGKYEVTQEFYRTIIGTNPSYFTYSPAAGEIQGKRPVDQVTWYDAIEFCNKLSEIEGLTPVYTITGRTPTVGYPITSATVTANWKADGYRLPTEAQWEYACRAGSTTRWYFGDDIYELANYAWYSAISGGKTHEVGKKLPNAFGLYDMYGNVREWCWDWYASLPITNQTDYSGAVSGSSRVMRGGDWDYDWANVYSDSSLRISYNPGSRRNWWGEFGFRVVLP